MTEHKISWTQRTWNPIVGCSHASPGCDHCYAERMAARMASNPLAPREYRGVVTDGRWNGKTALVESALLKPLRWSKPSLVFLGSMTDLFHPATPTEWIDRVFARMVTCPQHVFQVLTKRPELARDWMTDLDTPKRVARWSGISTMDWPGDGTRWSKWPLKNVWLGVTAEDQQRADERIPILLDTPAAKRFVSVEPMLGEVDLAPWLGGDDGGFICKNCGVFEETDRDCATCGADAWEDENGKQSPLNWVICGGETGPGARPMHPEWARRVCDQCAMAGVPFHFKSWGEWVPHDFGSVYLDRSGRMVTSTAASEYNGFTVSNDSVLVRRVGKRAAGRLLDGVLHDAMPEVRT